jgi:membrane protein YdbS with pleckstrin-like domain
MSKNMGNMDRGLRLAVALVLLVLAFTTQFAAAGLLHWAFIAIAAVFILTSVVGNCPLYSIVGIKTCRT